MFLVRFARPPARPERRRPSAARGAAWRSLVWTGRVPQVCSSAARAASGAARALAGQLRLA